MLSLRDYSISAPLCLGFVLAVTFACYLQGLPGAFLLDDFHALQKLGDYGGVTNVVSFLRYVFGEEGREWSRSIAYASFLIDDQYWPTFPELFKLTNIALHLITGLVACLLALNLFRRFFDENLSLILSVLTASLWLLHPLQVSTTLYVVQRMTQLATIFTLLALLFHVFALQSVTKTNFFTCLLVSAFFGFFGVLSKESALSGIWLMGLIAYFFFPQENEGMYVKCLYRRLLYFFGFLLLAFFIYKALQSGFGFRVFDQWQRLGIQALVLIKYLQYWLWPWGSDMGLFHDDIEFMVQSEGVGLKSLWWLFHCGLIGGVILCRKNIPVIAFGVLFFYVGHIIESTLWPLELMYEHRNYLPTIGLAVATAGAILMVVRFFKNKGLSVLGVGVIALVLGCLTISLAHRSAIWGDYRMLVSKWAYEHPNSLRSQSYMADMLASSGMVSMSARKLHDMHERMPSLTVKLQHVYLQCRETLSDTGVVVINQEEVKASKFTSGILNTLDQAVKSGDVPCLQSYMVGFNFTWLLRQVGNMTDLLSNPRFLAKFHEIEGRYYINERNYDLSVKAFLNMFNTQPTISTSLRVVELFLMGGDCERAQKFLNIAKEKNAKRWYRDQVRDAEIMYLQARIDRFQAVKVN